MLRCYHPFWVVGVTVICRGVTISMPTTTEGVTVHRGPIHSSPYGGGDDHAPYDGGGDSGGGLQTVVLQTGPTLYISTHTACHCAVDATMAMEVVCSSSIAVSMGFRVVNGGGSSAYGGGGVDHDGCALGMFDSSGLPQDGAQTMEVQHCGSIDVGYEVGARNNMFGKSPQGNGSPSGPSLSVLTRPYSCYASVPGCSVDDALWWIDGSGASMRATGDGNHMYNKRPQHAKRNNMCVAMLSRRRRNSLGG